MGFFENVRSSVKKNPVITTGALVIFGLASYPAYNYNNDKYQDFMVEKKLEKLERRYEGNIIGSKSVEDVLKAKDEYNEFNNFLVNAGVHVSGMGYSADVERDARDRLEEYGTNLNKELLQPSSDEKIEKVFNERDKLNNYLSQAGLEVVNVTDNGVIEIVVKK